LFTGLLPFEHGVVGRNDRIGSTRLLAEELSAAGFETFAFSENPWLQPESDLQRGFDSFQTKGDMVRAVRNWAKNRESDRPFFLFLNMMDAHEPYSSRGASPFLPPGVTRRQALKALNKQPGEYLCQTSLSDPDMALKRALYWSGVRSADDRLGQMWVDLVELRAAGPVILIITSDHGDLFGEKALVGHTFGLQHRLLHVPLIIHGLPGIAPALIRTPVQLADVMPSILHWAGARIPDRLFGNILPTSPTKVPSSAIIASYHDDFSSTSELPAQVRELIEKQLDKCGAEDRVLGDMSTIIRYPYKLIWYARYPPQLFDLSADPLEQHDLSVAEPEILASLRAELDAVSANAKDRPAAPQRELDSATIEQLRALGYLGGDADTEATP
jgi:arylsulfatase A-like enzyme